MWGIGRALRDWWRVDRIRISPREGQLLRLTTGAIVVVADRRIVIQSRSATPNDGGGGVTYVCDSADGPLILRIATAAPFGQLLVLPDGRVFLAGEVEVFAKEDN